MQQKEGKRVDCGIIIQPECRDGDGGSGKPESEKQ